MKTIMCSRFHIGRRMTSWGFIGLLCRNVAGYSVMYGINVGAEILWQTRSEGTVLDHNLSVRTQDNPSLNNPAKKRNFRTFSRTNQSRYQFGHWMNKGKGRIGNMNTLHSKQVSALHWNPVNNLHIGPTPVEACVPHPGSCVYAKVPH